MRFIDSKTHGYLDYATALLLIASPWIFGFWAGGAESWVPIILGVGLAFYSLLTDYELSITKGISLKAHLTMDVISGLFLAFSPWLFQFSELVYLPHLIIGIMEVGAGLMTHTYPAYKTRHTEG